MMPVDRRLSGLRNLIARRPSGGGILSGRRRGFWVATGSYRSRQKETVLVQYGHLCARFHWRTKIKRTTESRLFNSPERNGTSTELSRDEDRTFA